MRHIIFRPNKVMYIEWLKNIRLSISESNDWANTSLALHNAIVSCGTFDNPLDPSMENLTWGEWQLQIAKRATLATIDTILNELEKQ